MDGHWISFDYVDIQVKQFHPDVRHDKGSSDIMIRRVIKAYEVINHFSNEAN